MMARKANNYYLELKNHWLDLPYYHEKRRVRVLLPKDYHKETWATYPVLYLHDGQNVFYSREAFAGYSWKLIPTIKQSIDLPKMIIVGIDNHGEKRLDEYGPWQSDLPTEGQAGGDGMAYADWVVNTVKPFIDHKYRTKPERQSTLLAGSSMGGLITAYMGAAYPDVFGTLGVFSLCSWFSQRDFLRFIASHPLNKQTRLYIQTGTKEGDEADAAFISDMNQAYIDCALNYYQRTLEAGLPLAQIWLRILANETHSEYYWAKHFKEFLSFAFADQKFWQ